MPKLNRRQLLGAGVATAAVLRSSDLLAAEAAPAPAPAPAAAADVIEVSGTDRKKMVAAALEALGGIGAFVKKGHRVVLKPNLAFAQPPDFAAGTHPDLLFAVTEACFKAGAKEVLVAENPLSDAEKCWTRTGCREALKAFPEVKMRMLEEHEEYREVKVPKGLVLKDCEVAKCFLDYDVFISLPQAKHHSSANVSFGLKSAMGAVWSRKPFHIFMDLQKGIADLGFAVKPHLTILDAVRVLQTNGPKGPGEVASPGKMFAGRNVVAVDAAALSVCKFDGRMMTLDDAKHIKYASAHGLGECDVAKLKIKKVAT
ncbi:MAG TPA: DUF362 domain-containing protein [Myxococcales bacterium]|jgi:uncharacterized protein (DUF362 family)